MKDLQEPLLSQTIDFVKQELTDAEGGHDWFHVERVWKTSRTIGQQEGADLLTVELAALLHDIADSKFYQGDEEIGPAKAKLFLDTLELDRQTVDHVINIIRYVSFSKSFDGVEFNSKELEVVQDADRLDAMGAIGIARTFNYGGHKGFVIYDPDIPPNLNMTKEEYKSTQAPTINHFYEKLLLLKDRMNTDTGKKMADERHQFMLEYLQRFYQEWEGEL